MCSLYGFSQCEEIEVIRVFQYFLVPVHLAVVVNLLLKLVCALPSSFIKACFLHIHQRGATPVAGNHFVYIEQCFVHALTLGHDFNVMSPRHKSEFVAWIIRQQVVGKLTHHRLYRI